VRSGERLWPSRFRVIQNGLRRAPTPVACHPAAMALHEYEVSPPLRHRLPLNHLGAP
jgi:hypothetical protein